MSLSVPNEMGDHLSNGKNRACERRKITDKERRDPAISVLKVGNYMHVWGGGKTGMKEQTERMEMNSKNWPCLGLLETSL